MSDFQNITPRQRRTVGVLLTAKTLRDAAQAAGVAERTLYRWLDDPDFQAALKAAQRESLAIAVRRLSALANEAVSVLEDAMDSEKTVPTSRVRAADLTLSRLPDLVQLHDFEERLSRLEAMINVPEN